MVVECLVEDVQRDVNVSASNFSIERLVRRDLVSDVRRKGHKIVRDCFVVTYLHTGSDTAKVALHIRKKFGNAVARNRAKRVFRASLYDLREMIQGKDLIITPRRTARGLGTPEIALLLKKCFAEAGMSQRK